MGKAKRPIGKRRVVKPKSADTPMEVDSLLDAMKEGNEYSSIVSLIPKNSDLIPEVRRALKEIEDIRKRPCLCYLANVVNPALGSSIIDQDDLPFNEMVGNVDGSIKNIDVMVVTNGGSAQQVAQFVDALRPRFDSVEYILPYKCMSAGTLWVLSGDKIWMDERAFIGPIDPQERMSDGTFIPSQSIISLVNKFNEDWKELKAKGESPPITQVRILDNIDPRRLGNAITMTRYVQSMASDFLYQFKFKSWNKHSTTNIVVTDDEKREKANQISESLASNDQWKSHGHGLSRDVVEKELKVKVDKLESVNGLEKAVRRFWALMYWVFDKTATAKMTLSQNYLVVRNFNIKKQGK